MVYTHVLNQGGHGVVSPLDQVTGRAWPRQIGCETCMYSRAIQIGLSAVIVVSVVALKHLRSSQIAPIASVSPPC